ncbi:uncharacterized protein LOC116093114 isoform X2 [Mastomys coucha]|uniref:uncharacterized protein LOC116093114 isoform X2 n=1 Tax=Mastomys coucha TaxID=35658 RepID=UPI0012622151|nr:uncharacterized protein LOC116093114 isoform X2 [Mastomys coucha]
MLRQRYWSRILHSIRREELGETSGRQRRRVASPSAAQRQEAASQPEAASRFGLFGCHHRWPASLVLGFSPGRVGAPPSRPLSEDMRTMVSSTTDSSQWFSECLVHAHARGWRRLPWPCRGSDLVGKQTSTTQACGFPATSPVAFWRILFLEESSDSRYSGLWVWAPFLFLQSSITQALWNVR